MGKQLHGKQLGTYKPRYLNNLAIHNIPEIQVGTVQPS